MDKTISYVNYQSPDQLNQILEMLTKTFLI